ncbi:class I SAM-dependent methyltransferase [Mucilaginibacter gotjawali]|uniref:Ubiquinone/menaquinone biosynthesis C-methylase UbiE n=1 Tax=Mucilaginibacter gotjawali TaxID=1550579 RepID=A0A839SEE9_9SPHI|nr:class I SAM-dependent methyltransferase [Mucilaginibacter gotjawali]MBB3054907.1 ubiquinone/menaquinone biosynthesis C-methylase UbiE [Mucilaginibacter gotjawali]
MAANYNNSAWFYDGVSRLVYGKALIKAQVYLLRFIPPNSNVLIVGGGTGWILEEIVKIHPSGLQCTYVEVAPKMMARSKKRDTGNNQVVFINKAIEDIPFLPGFDIVVTPFLFDNFTEQTFKQVFNRIHSLLKPGGLWLNCDFQLKGKWWQRELLKSMFLFFRLICNIEASALPAIEKQFEQYGYETIASQTFFGEFIISEVFKTR